MKTDPTAAGRSRSTPTRSSARIRGTLPLNVSWVGRRECRLRVERQRDLNLAVLEHHSLAVAVSFHVTPSVRHGRGAVRVPTPLSNPSVLAQKHVKNASKRTTAAGLSVSPPVSHPYPATACFDTSARVSPESNPLQHNTQTISQAWKIIIPGKSSICGGDCLCTYVAFAPKNAALILPVNPIFMYKIIMLSTKSAICQTKVIDVEWKFTVHRRWPERSFVALEIIGRPPGRGAAGLERRRLAGCE